MNEYQFNSGRPSAQFDKHTQQNNSAQGGRPQLSTFQEIISKLKNGIEIKVDRSSDHLTIDLSPRTQPKVDYRALKSFVGILPMLQSTIGWGENQAPAIIDFGSDELNHLFITGGSKIGKSTLLKTLLADLAANTKPSHVQYALIDGFRRQKTGRGGQSTGLEPFEYLPHTLAYTSHSAEEAAELVIFIREELEYRTQNQINSPLVILAIDDVHDLIEIGPAETIQHLTYIADQGPQNGVALILSGTTNQDYRIQDVLEASRFCRIVGRVSDHQQAEIATSLLGSQAEHLSPKGDFLLINGGVVSRFGAAALQDDDFNTLIESIYNHRPPTLLAQSFVEPPTFEIDNEELNPDDSGSEYLYEEIETTPRPLSYSVHETPPSYKSDLPQYREEMRVENRPDKEESSSSESADPTDIRDESMRWADRNPYYARRSNSTQVSTNPTPITDSSLDESDESDQSKEGATKPSLLKRHQANGNRAIPYTNQRYRPIDPSQKEDPSKAERNEEENVGEESEQALKLYPASPFNTGVEADELEEIKEEENFELFPSFDQTDAAEEDIQDSDQQPDENLIEGIETELIQPPLLQKSTTDLDEVADTSYSDDELFPLDNDWEKVEEERTDGRSSNMNKNSQLDNGSAVDPWEDGFVEEDETPLEHDDQIVAEQDGEQSPLSTPKTARRRPPQIGAIKNDSSSKPEGRIAKKGIKKRPPIISAK